MAVAIRTFCTIIFLQLIGKICAKDLVVMQNEALVLEANVSYFLEWKKVISSLFASLRSLIFDTLDWVKSLFSIFKDFKSLSILKGPLFLKKD